MDAIMDALEAVEQRLEWAWRDIERINEKIKALMEGDGPYRVVPELQPDGVTQHYRAELVRPIPPDLSFRVADATNNLRATLDNLVWAVASTYVPPPPRLAFPVFGDAAGFTKTALPMLKAAQLPQGAIDAIEALQPYSGPDPAEHALRLLNDRWNHDKHRSPILTCAVPSWGLFEIHEGEIDVAVAIGQRVESGTVLAIARPKPGQQARFTGQLSLAVAFDEDGGLLGRLLPQCLIDHHHLILDSALEALRPFVR